MADRSCISGEAAHLIVVVKLPLEAFEQVANQRIGSFAGSFSRPTAAGVATAATAAALGLSVLLRLSYHIRGTVVFGTNLILLVVGVGKCRRKRGPPGKVQVLQLRSTRYSTSVTAEVHQVRIVQVLQLFAVVLLYYTLHLPTLLFLAPGSGMNLNVPNPGHLHST